jgi:hypothetical protein
LIWLNGGCTEIDYGYSLELSVNSTFYRIFEQDKTTAGQIVVLLKKQRRVSRRAFLSIVTQNMLSVAATLVLPAPVFAGDSMAKAIALENQSLGFADRQGLGPEMDAPDVERYYRPLHEEKLLPLSSTDEKTRETVTQILKLQFHNEGLQWLEGYQVGFTYQHYGVPDNREQTDPLLAYCQDASEFAHTKLLDMFTAQVNWQPLTHDDAVIGSSAFRGFVGRYTYYVMRAVVLNGESNSDLPYLVQARPVERAIHYIVSSETAAPKRGTLYIIPGTTSLVAPFSELLHLTFHEPSQRYAAELAEELSDDLAQERARIAGETVNEAAAIVLATEFLQKMGHGRRLSTVKAMADNLSDSYGYLPKAIEFMRRNSVQNAVDMYVDSPAKFMASIDNA